MDSLFCRASLQYGYVLPLKMSFKMGQFSGNPVTARRRKIFGLIWNNAILTIPNDRLVSEIQKF